MQPSRILLAAVAFTSGAAFAGTADVKFIAPERFTDLATSPVQERDTMDALARHLQRLAAGLPADHVLHVDVLDVDLAGYAYPTRRGNVRVNNGLADAPAIHLRYTLEARGQVIRSGDERLVDLAYQHPGGSWRSTGPFYYEKRMLSSWFARTFGESHAAR
ncbi:DUF3016 domain-containing protein [Ramlibacter sp. PS4R-6]|uniref:DUF3016 domain-containing protein n=1 Tax=Ramlibacter sp. PS4R-6 TaxID=3133438 RepID=UPI0030A7F468